MEINWSSLAPRDGQVSDPWRAGLAGCRPAARESDLSMTSWAHLIERAADVAVSNERELAKLGELIREYRGKHDIYRVATRVAPSSAMPFPRK